MTVAQICIEVLAADAETYNSVQNNSFHPILYFGEDVRIRQIRIILKFVLKYDTIYDVYIYCLKRMYDTIFCSHLNSGILIYI